MATCYHSVSPRRLKGINGFLRYDIFALGYLFAWWSLVLTQQRGWFRTLPLQKHDTAMESSGDRFFAHLFGVGDEKILIKI